jgi:hypothetical protein
MSRWSWTDRKQQKTMPRQVGVKIAPDSPKLIDLQLDEASKPTRRGELTKTYVRVSNTHTYYRDIHPSSAPGRTRTPDARFRRPALYPLSYGSLIYRRVYPVITSCQAIPTGHEVLIRKSLYWSFSAIVLLMCIALIGRWNRKTKRGSC